MLRYDLVKRRPIPDTHDLVQVQPSPGTTWLRDDLDQVAPAAAVVAEKVASTMVKTESSSNSISSKRSTVAMATDNATVVEATEYTNQSYIY